MSEIARRDVLTLAGITIAGGISISSAGAAQTLSRGRISETARQSADWPQFQSNSKNTGYLPDGTAPVTGVTKRWQFTTFADLDYMNAPVIVGQTVYLAARDFNLYAINATTGEQRWQYNTGFELEVTPAVANGTIFLPAKNQIIALATDTGKPQWKFDHRETGIKGHVTYTDGVVIPPTGPLTVLKASDGTVRWQRDVHPGFGVAVADGTVYVGERDSNRVYAFTLKDGTRQWRRAIDVRLVTGVPPVATDDSLYLMSQDQTLVALDANSGKTKWTYEIGGETPVDPERSTPAVGNGSVYVGEALTEKAANRGQPGAIHAIDAKTGDRQWRTETVSEVVDSPTIVDGVVYVGSRGAGDGGRLYALDAATGNVRWARQTSENVNAHAIVAGTIYAVTGDGYLHAFEERGTTSTRTTASAAPEPTESQSESEVTGTQTQEDTSRESTAIQTQSSSTPQSEPAEQSTEKRQRGFFTNKGGGPEFLQNVFNLTVLGFLLSVAGILHQMFEGR